MNDNKETRQQYNMNVFHAINLLKERNNQENSQNTYRCMTVADDAFLHLCVVFSHVFLAFVHVRKMYEHNTTTGGAIS